MWPQIIDRINLEAKIFFPVYDPKGWVEWQKTLRFNHEVSDSKPLGVTYLKIYNPKSFLASKVVRSGGSQFSVYALMHNMKSHFNRSCLTSLALLMHAYGFELRTYSAMFIFIFKINLFSLIAIQQSSPQESSLRIFLLDFFRRDVYMAATMIKRGLPSFAMLLLNSCSKVDFIL